MMWLKREKRNQPVQPVYRTPEEIEQLRRQRLTELAEEQEALRQQLAGLRGMFSYGERQSLKARIMELDIIMSGLK